MEIIKNHIFVKLTEEEQETLNDAYIILKNLYDIIAENNCEYMRDTCGNDYDRQEIALACNVLQMFPTEEVEIKK